MERERTMSAMPMEDAANKKWYLSMRPASPKETLTVRFDEGKSYKFLGTGQVAVGDPVIIDYGGASSYKMGNVIRIEQGVTIKRTHALKPLFTFTADPGKTEIKKNLAGIAEIKEIKDVSPFLDNYHLDENNGRFHIIDQLVSGVLNAISVVAFPDLAGDKAVVKAKLFLAEEKCVPAFVFGKEFTDEYFAVDSYASLVAETAESSFTGFYPGWKDTLLNCDVWSQDLGRVERTWDEREQAYYLYYKNGSKKLEGIFKNSESFRKMTNELVFRSALSILIRGGFKNLLEAALSVQMPIADFYDQLVVFADEVGSNECLRVLHNTDYKSKTFEKVTAPTSKLKAAAKDFVIDDDVLKEYKGKEEVVAIPDGIKTIDKFAFDGNGSIKKIIMPDTVTAIKEAAFRSCKRLEEVVFSKRLTSIAPFTFAADEALKFVDLSNTKLKSVRKKCFFNCCNLESIELPNTLRSIEDDAFTRTSIKEYHFPASIEKIAPSAFGTSFGSFPAVITDVYFAGTNAVEFNFLVLTSAGKNGRIHCIKGSDLWRMFETQKVEIVDQWNKYSHLEKRVFPEMVEL